MKKLKTLKLVVVLSITFSVLSLVSCGGGGSSAAPQLQIQPIPGSQLSAQVIDASKVVAARNGNQAGSLVVLGSPGACLPSMNVIISDSNGIEQVVSSQGDGSFNANSFPPGFITNSGSYLSLSQEGGGLAPSIAIQVPVI